MGILEDALKRPINPPSQTDLQLMVEAIDHMKITPKQKEFVRAAMRTAIEYATMKRAGFSLSSTDGQP